MGNVKEGGRAGFLAGLIYAIAEAAVVVTLLVAFKSNVIKVISAQLGSGSTPNANAAYNLLVAVDAAIAVVFGVLAGVVLGIIFGAVSDRVPGKPGVTKGLVFGFLLWLILHVVADYFENLRYGVTFYLVDIGLGLGTSLLYGALLGIFFEREMKGKVPSRERSKGADEERGTQGSYPTGP